MENLNKIKKSDYFPPISVTVGKSVYMKTGSFYDIAKISTIKPIIYYYKVQVYTANLKFR